MRLLKALKGTNTVSVAAKFNNRHGGSKEEMTVLMGAANISKKDVAGNGQTYKEFLTTITLLNCLEQSTKVYKQAGCFFGLGSKTI